MLFDSNFSGKEKIVNYFDRRCKDYGFNGVFIINTAFNAKDLIKIDSNVEEVWYLREPSTSTTLYIDSLQSIPHIIISRLGKTLSSRYINKYNGDTVLRARTGFVSDFKYIPGVFFGWDNTPRHGSRGEIITSPSKDSFMKYMDSIKDSEYVFINAWNEWCEGIMLEPTEENGYKYLEWIKEWTEKNENRINGF